MQVLIRRIIFWLTPLIAYYILSLITKIAPQISWFWLCLFLFIPIVYSFYQIVKNEPIKFAILYSFFYLTLTFLFIFRTFIEFWFYFFGVNRGDISSDASSLGLLALTTITYVFLLFLSWIVLIISSKIKDKKLKKESTSTEMIPQGRKLSSLMIWLIALILLVLDLPLTLLFRLPDFLIPFCVIIFSIWGIIKGIRGFKEQKKWKVFLGIILCVVLLILSIDILLDSFDLLFLDNPLKILEIKLAENMQPKDETAGWNTYKDNELGFQFNYPAEWGDISLKEENNDIKNWPGNMLRYDNNDFLIQTFSKDFKPFDWTILNTQKVDVDWSASDFAKNMGIDNPVFFTKKLDDKVMLVSYYDNSECSPSAMVIVLTPFLDSYPNFEIGLHFPNDPILQDEQKKEVAETGTACDMSEGFKKVAQKIYNGEYSDLNSKIQIAKEIADSVQVIPTD